MPAKSIYAVESAAPLPDPDALRSVKVGELNRLTMAVLEIYELVSDPNSRGFDFLQAVFFFNSIIWMLRAMEVDARGDLAYEVGGFKLLVPADTA